MPRDNRLKRVLAKLGRTAPKDSIRKISQADQHGIFQNFQTGVTDFKTRSDYLSTRGGTPVDRENLYGLGPEHKDSTPTNREIAPHLSTRYSPDRPGIQARRISDGVYQDPYTNKVYDYNEGFKTEDGRQFPGGDASLQTDIWAMAKHLDQIGLKKEAKFLKELLKK